MKEIPHLAPSSRSDPTRRAACHTQLRIKIPRAIKFVELIMPENRRLGLGKAFLAVIKTNMASGAAVAEVLLSLLSISPCKFAM